MNLLKNANLLQRATVLQATKYVEMYIYLRVQDSPIEAFFVLIHFCSIIPVNYCSVFPVLISPVLYYSFLLSPVQCCCTIQP